MYILDRYQVSFKAYYEISQLARILFKFTYRQTKDWVHILKGMSGWSYDWTFQVTPYIHVMVQHVPQIMRRYGSIKLFSDQGKKKQTITICKVLLLNNKIFMYLLLFF